MKKFLIFLLVILSSSYSESFSQTGWTRVTDSIPNLVIMSMQFTSASRGYACGSYNTTAPGSFLRTTNGGLNWQVTQFPEYSADDLTFLNDNTGYISAWQGAGKSFVLKTTNGGINWFKLDSNYASFFKIKFYDSLNGMIASKYSTNHRTTDGGNTWVTRYNNSNWHEPNSLICLSADTWLVADKSSSINKTTNGGVNWDCMNFSTIGMECVSMYFLNNTTGFSIDYNCKVFKTTNAGNNWFKIDSIRNVYSFYSASIMFTDINTGYISSGNSVYKTTNGGYNWSKQTVYTNTSLYSLYFINANTGFVGGWHGFIYRTTTGGTIGINSVSEETPENYTLFQNYPNPFNPITKIRFEIPNGFPTGTFGNDKVVLKIYDLSAKEIQTLVNESLQPGTYEVTFDGSKLNSGVYFYNLTTGDYSRTKKMVLIK
jgi:photosystem II stability/assembly factor-like uncharacterized protein